MSLDGVPGYSEDVKAMIVIVRSFLRDHPPLNKLVAGEESTDRQIAWAVLDAVSEFNGTPPRSYLSLSQILEEGQQYLLVRMTVSSLMESIGLLQTRNHVNYSVGGLNVGVNDKTPLVMNWIQTYRNLCEQKLLRVKIAINIESALGFEGVASELWAVNIAYAGYT